MITLDETGKNYLSWHGPQALLVITEPELIKQFLNNKEGAFVKPKVGVYLKKLVGDGLPVTRGGPKWSKLRKIANHAFYADSLKVNFCTFARANPPPVHIQTI